jgi:hypothetical protein
VLSFIAVCPKLCHAPTHGKEPLPCHLAFAVRQSIAKHHCHVLTHDKEPSTFEHRRGRAPSLATEVEDDSRSGRPNPQEQTSTGSTLTLKTPRWQGRSWEDLFLSNGVSTTMAPRPRHKKEDNTDTTTKKEKGPPTSRPLNHHYKVYAWGSVLRGWSR